MNCYCNFKRIFFLLAILLFSNSTFAINEHLNSTCPALYNLKLPNKKTAFIQEKFVSGLSKPLSSKGYIFENDLKNIVIETTEPEAYTMTFDNSKIMISKRNSENKLDTSIIDQDEASQLSRFIVTLLKEKSTDDINFLKNAYDLSCNIKDSILLSGKLKNNDSPTYIKSFVIKGSTTPSNIELSDNDDGKVIISILHD